MKETKEKQLCPTCGQPMEFVKSIKKPINSSDQKKTSKFENDTDEGYDIMEIWHCLNCSTTWELEVFKNIWRKNPLTKE